MDFWKHEGHATGAIPLRYVVVLLILNEIRGLIAVSAVIRAWFG